MKTLITFAIILMSVIVYGQSSGFYNKVKDPTGKFLRDTCICPKADTNHYSLWYAPNGVAGGTYTLKKAQHLTYNYPVDGWRWADSKKEAKQIFKLKKDVMLKDTTDNIPE